jgi:hypothetical protein
MRLVFSVLWFDDSEDYFDSLDLDPLREEISSWGFSPQIEKVTTPEEFSSRSPFAIYDLIVVDRTLEGYPSGQEFIADLRSHSIYTEIIFYTAGNVSDLWGAIREKELEGVFVSSRNDILSKIMRIGRQSIRKVLDIENMRGIVMAEVGELDLLLDQILVSGIESLQEEHKNSIFTKFYEGAIEQSNQRNLKLEEFMKNPEPNGMLIFCDSDKRWANFNRLGKHHSKLRGRPKIDDYAREVLQPRNFLAHGRPELHQERGYVFRYQGKEFIFDETVSLELRKKILKYKEIFSSIIELIKDA